MTRASCGYVGSSLFCGIALSCALMAGQLRAEPGHDYRQEAREALITWLQSGDEYSSLPERFRREGGLILLYNVIAGVESAAGKSSQLGAEVDQLPQAARENQQRWDLLKQKLYYPTEKLARLLEQSEVAETTEAPEQRKSDLQTLMLASYKHIQIMEEALSARNWARLKLSARALENAADALAKLPPPVEHMETPLPMDDYYAYQKLMRVQARRFLLHTMEKASIPQRQVFDQELERLKSSCEGCHQLVRDRDIRLLEKDTLISLRDVIGGFRP